MNVAERTSLVAAVRHAVRDVPDFPRPGIVFKDITPLLGDAALFSRTVGALAESGVGQGISHVVSMESRGFIFGAPVAVALGAAFVPVRKRGKLPAATVTEEYNLEYGTDCLEMHADALTGSAGVMVLDDVLATGGTAAAACRLIERGGGRVTSCTFLLELTFLSGRVALGSRTVNALVSY